MTLPNVSGTFLGLNQILTPILALKVSFKNNFRHLFTISDMFCAFNT